MTLKNRRPLLTVNIICASQQLRQNAERFSNFFHLDYSDTRQRDTAKHSTEKLQLEMHGKD